jgi:hypothetical protein
VRTPSWFDLRLVAGAVLVVGSVLAGIAVVASAHRTQRVWAVAHDLGPGIVLEARDLVVVSVRLPAGRSAYFAADAPVAGLVVTRQLDAGELLPKAAVGDAQPSTTVTIPLSADDAPVIRAGQRITVWVSTRACASATVLADTAVQEVREAQGAGFGASGGEDVIVRLSPADAERVIQALALSGGVLRAGVITGPRASPTALPELTPCGASGS